MSGLVMAVGLATARYALALGAFCSYGFFWWVHVILKAHRPTVTVVDTPVSPEVNATFDDFWRDIVCPDGRWDLGQVKRELSDYRSMLSEVPKVYDEITWGVISKPNTVAFDVLAVHEDRCPLVDRDQERELRQQGDDLRAALGVAAALRRALDLATGGTEWTAAVPDLGLLAAIENRWADEPPLVTRPG